MHRFKDHFTQLLLFTLSCRPAKALLQQQISKEWLVTQLPLGGWAHIKKAASSQHIPSAVLQLGQPQNTDAVSTL